MSRLLSGTLLLALSSFLSRLLGIYRTNRFAAIFGAGGQTDAYYAAFQIPDLLYNLIIYGAISAAFIPMLSEFIAHNQAKKAWEFVSNLLNILLVITFGCGLIIFIFTPQIIALLYSGFSPETQSLTVDLTRIMLITPLFFCLSGIAGGIQNVYHQFLSYSLAPILYNLSIIAGIVWLGPTYGMYGVAYGVVFGAFLHMLIQLPAIFQKGFRWQWILDWKRADLRESISLSVPRVFALGITQINLIIEAIIAATLTSGSLTVLRYAQDLQYFPIGIVGLSFAISSFGMLSKLAAKKEFEKMAILISDNIHKILYLIIPASVGLYVLRDEIITAILHFGKFEAETAFITANILGILCINLFALSITPFLTRVYYAYKNTFTPLIIGIATIAINLILSLSLSKIYGIYGIAIANVLAYIFQWASLSIFLFLEYQLSGLLQLRKISQIGLSTGCMGFIIYLINPYFLIPVWFKIPLLSSIGIILYSLCTWNLSENIVFRKILIPRAKNS